VAEEILCSINEGIATITLNRPEKRNAMNTAVLEGLEHYFGELETNNDVRAIIVRGEGKAFCAGLDLRELNARQHSDEDAESGIIELLGKIETSRHPTIAMVQGDALAGGCELALHCDLRVVSDLARFGMPLARLGLVIPFPLCQKLVEIVGPAYTKQILLSGQPVEATRAYDMGMVHQLVPAAELEQATYGLARTIADNAPLSLSGMKTTIHRAISLRETIEYQDLQQVAAAARTSQDAKEGVKAMLEKRKPQFRGA
jgi:enoyl-CoA hydratase/carnithine racemase